MNNFKIHFIANPEINDDLEVLRSLAWEEGTLACTQHTWVWALYCQMKMRGFNVSLGYDLESDAINCIHGQVARGLLKASDFRNYFIIGIRADFRPFPYGDFEIVQNKKSKGRHCFYMPLFPQPGLIMRDAHRDKVVNVCFSGRVQNSIDIHGIESELKEMGCRLVFKGVGHWHEMSDIDILLGIRSFSREPHHTKPPTKMFNAWLAGIPFIGGYDSAFEQVGVPGVDYVRVASKEELIDVIGRLCSDSKLYQQLVWKGKDAGRNYTPDKITDRWVCLFHEQIFPRYRRWRDEPSFGWRIRRFVRSQRFFLREKIITQLLLIFRGQRNWGNG